MIFKPKVKGKFKQFFQSAVVLSLLAVMGVTSLQFSTQVKAASSDTVLKDNMSHFVKIGDYVITETTGKKLNSMFDLSKHNKSTLNATSNYIAYYKIDKRKVAVLLGPPTRIFGTQKNGMEMLEITKANQDIFSITKH